MNTPNNPTSIRRMFYARVKKMVPRGPVLAASLVKIKKHCGRQGCRCQRGEKHVGNYLTFKVEGKTKTVYVPLDMVEEVRAWIKEHQRLKKLSREVSQLAVALVRTRVEERKSKGVRP